MSKHGLALESDGPVLLQCNSNLASLPVADQLTVPQLQQFC